MKTIFKYQLLLASPATVMLPIGAQVLSVQDQGGVLQLWALVESANTTMVERRFIIAGTGFQVDQYAIGAHVATVQQGSYVWHIFEAAA